MKDVICQTLSSGEIIIRKIFLKDPHQSLYEQAQRLVRNEDLGKTAESDDAGQGEFIDV